MASGSPAIRDAAPAARAGSGSADGFAIARLLEETGWWLFLASLLGGAAVLGATPTHLGLALVAWLLLRPALVLVGPRVHPLLGYGALLLGIGAALVLNWARLVEGFELILLVLVAIGGARSLAASRRAGQLAAVLGPRARAAAELDVRVGWLGMALGGASAALGLLIMPSFLVVPAALLLALVGSLVGRALLGDPLHSRSTDAEAPAHPASAPADGGPRFVPLERAAPRAHLAAAAAGGALVVGLIGLLAERGAAMAADAPFVAIGVALIGLGGGLSRVPLVRLRQRLPEALVAAALGWALAGLVALLGLAWTWLLALPLLVAVGFVAAALVRESVLHLRQLGDRARPAALRLAAVHALGQLGGAVAIALLPASLPVPGGALSTLAVAAAAVIGVGLLADRRSLSALRHQVQQFSWNASPAPRAFEEPPGGSRAARLSGWVHRRAELELVDVRLPVSGRHYAIARPSGDGRDRLFEEAKADPERQMPYWAKVWPSGVALADIVVERAAEVRDRQVLELGAGLGVTACTVLEEGGRLVTADYSLLPLALCRLNGLLNTGRAPGSSCFNWRDEAQVEEVLRRHPPIGLILAADVLYEFRDIKPLIDVIERLLAPGGSLWLAEPVRRTAQRFLDIVAAQGWTIESRRIRAAWPDATDGWVNVHVIRREQEPAELVLGLAGGQL